MFNVGSINYLSSGILTVCGGYRYCKGEKIDGLQEAIIGLLIAKNFTLEPHSISRNLLAGSAVIISDGFFKGSKGFLELGVGSMAAAASYALSEEKLCLIYATALLALNGAALRDEVLGDFYNGSYLKAGLVTVFLELIYP